MDSNVPQQTEPPKSNRQCRLCREHSVASSYLDHKTCPFLSCKCDKCNLIKLQRRIMAEQIKLRRQNAKQKAGNLVTPYAKYNCQYCKNHGIEVSKKRHYDCPYKKCRCEFCCLTHARSLIELEIKRKCGDRQTKSPKIEANNFGTKNQAIEPVNQFNFANFPNNLNVHRFSPLPINISPLNLPSSNFPQLNLSLLNQQILNASNQLNLPTIYQFPDKIFNTFFLSPIVQTPHMNQIDLLSLLPLQNSLNFYGA